MKDPIAPWSLITNRIVMHPMARRATNVPTAFPHKTITSALARRSWFDLPRLIVLISLMAAAMAGPPTASSRTIVADTHPPAISTQRQLQLDHGQRWPTDVTLREGMQRIRAVAIWIQRTQVDRALSARQSRAAVTWMESHAARQ